MIDMAIDGTDLTKARRVLETLGDKARPIVAKALNRAARGIPTDASKFTRQTYNVKARQVKESFSVQYANKNDLMAYAQSKGGTISLYRFGARPRHPRGRRPRRGVSVKVMDVRKKIPGSFIAAPKGGIGIFRRKGSSRFPIEKLYGPSVPQMVDNVDAIPDIEHGAEERFSKNLEHEIDYKLSKMGLR